MLLRPKEAGMATARGQWWPLEDLLCSQVCQDEDRCGHPWTEVVPCEESCHGVEAGGDLSIRKLAVGARF